MKIIKIVGVVIVSLLLITVLISTFTNHRYVNNKTEEILINIDNNITQINLSVLEIKEQHLETLLTVDTIYNSEQFNCLKTKLDENSESTKKHLCKLKELSSRTFDANTITFLISFIFVALVTYLLTTLTNVNKIVSEAEKQCEEAKKQYKTAENHILKQALNISNFDMYLTRLSCIHSHSILARYILSINAYATTKEFMTSVYKMERELSSLSRKIENDMHDGLKLQQKDKDKIIEIADDIKNNIDSNKIRNVNNGQSGSGQVDQLIDNIDKFEVLIEKVEVLDILS